VRRSAAVAEEVDDTRPPAGVEALGCEELGCEVPGAVVPGLDVSGSDVPDGVAERVDVDAEGEEVDDVGAVVVAASAGDGARTAAADSGSAASRAATDRLRSGRRGNVTVGVFRQRSGHLSRSTVSAARGGVSPMKQRPRRG
jgi:hypothetical protein